MIEHLRERDDRLPDRFARATSCMEHTDELRDVGGLELVDAAGPEDRKDAPHRRPVCEPRVLEHRLDSSSRAEDRASMGPCEWPCPCSLSSSEGETGWTRVWCVTALSIPRSPVDSGDALPGTSVRADAFSQARPCHRPSAS